MVDYIDVAKPVAISASLGLLAGWLYSQAAFNIAPHAMGMMLLNAVSMVAIVKRSKALARLARLVAAAVAVWMIADVAGRLGAPPYAALVALPLLYKSVPLSASIIGGVFGASMGAAAVFVMPIVSLMDLLLVYKTRLFLASATLNTAVAELAWRFKTFSLGFADFLWYAIAVAAAGPAKAVFVIAAIYAGLVATVRIVQKRGYAPALPIPLFLAQVAFLAPIPRFF